MKVIDDFWLNDIKVLYRQDKLNEFFPVQGMTNNEKLNSIVRLAFYLATVLMFSKKTLNVFIIPITIAIVTIFIEKFNTADEDTKELDLITMKIEEFEDCQMPTEENPYMNTLISDLSPDVEKKKACRLTKEIRKKQHELFYKDLPRDVGDLYEKSNSERMFHTVPETTKFGVNNGDSKAFRDFLLNIGETCKENNLECTNAGSLFFDDLRNKRNTIIKDDILLPM